MEINGVNFRDFACASANIVAGMPTEKVCEVLGIEEPVWEDTKNQWNGKMAEMTMDDMKFYGEVFTNPKQGKFANVEGGASTDNALDKVPNIKKFAKIFEHMSVAADHGVDPTSIMENEYDLNHAEWAKASSHYSQILLQATEDQDIFDDYYLPHDKASKKYTKKFKKMYKENSADLSQDIDF